VIEIEKGIKLPERSGANATKYPWAHMEIGDSFLMPTQKPSLARSGACSAGKRYGMKFRTAQEAGGIRVWRIA
jgi:hypothetical protein